jgi:hypothetical protein
MPDIMKKMLSKETTVYYMEHNFILSSAHEAPTNHLHISLLSTNKPFTQFSSVYQQTIYTFLFCLPTNHLHISQTEEKCVNGLLGDRREICKWFVGRQ